MPTPNETMLYDQLRALLNGTLPFDRFWDWLMPLQRTIPHTDPARRVLFAIIAKIDEYDETDMTDEELKDELSALFPASFTLTPKVLGRVASEEFTTKYAVISSGQTTHRYRTPKEPQPYWRQLLITYVRRSSIGTYHSDFPRLDTKHVTVSA